MNYDKPFLHVEELADRLLSQGLVANRDELIEKLTHVNYYRLKLYWHPFRKHIGKGEYRFIPGTKFESIWKLYRFDRMLRLMVLDGIERVEIAIRTIAIHIHSREFGPFGYLNCDNLPNLGKNKIPDHSDYLKRVDRIVSQRRSRVFKDDEKKDRDTFLYHHFKKYNPDRDLPLWVLCELFDYGLTFDLFRGLERSHQQEIAKMFSKPQSTVSDTVLESWLDSLRYVRNLCAHHSRLWNRTLTGQLKIPRKKKLQTVDIWQDNYPINNKKIFSVLTVLCYMLSIIIPKSRWKYRLYDLLLEFPEIPLEHMGFPKGWEKSEIWKLDDYKTGQKES